MKKIALFGTSADPPTLGHQTILSWLSNHYDSVVVWASDNPFKPDQTPLSYRSEMLQLTIADLNIANNKIQLHRELSDRFTWVTVNKAKEKWGEEDVEFTLVIGADILRQITSWYRIQDLLKQVKVLVIPRWGYEIKQQDLQALTKIGGNYGIADFNPPQVSSSSYRLHQDQSLVIPAVNDYIGQHSLYHKNPELIIKC